MLLLPVSAEHAFEYDADIVGLERGLEVAAAHWPLVAVATLGFPAVSYPLVSAPDFPSACSWWAVGDALDE